MKVSDLLAKVKNDYNLIADDFSKTRQNLKWPEIDGFKKYLKNDQKILDLGCGNGRLLNSLAELKVEYHGLDNSENLISLAKELHSDKADSFKVGEMFALPYDDNYFDVIVCLASFHHLPTKELRLSALLEMKRVLKKDGVVLMTNWYVWQKLFWQNLFTNFTLKNSWNDFFIPWKSKTKVINRYYHGFTKGELQKLFQQSGLMVSEHQEFLKRNWLSVLKK